MPQTRVCARMKPEDKVSAVQLLQRHQVVVGMVGDGGNDSAALRAAQFGFALSESDASLVAPFSASAESLEPVTTILCGGRAALTNMRYIFAWFVVMGLILPLNKLILVWDNGNLGGEVPGVYIDLCLELTMVFFMAMNRPLPKLTEFHFVQKNTNLS